MQKKPSVVTFPYREMLDRIMTIARLGGARVGKSPQSQLSYAILSMAEFCAARGWVFGAPISLSADDIASADLADSDKRLAEVLK